MLQLSTNERRDLRARAHGLNPVVSIAENGLTESVLKEIDLNLKAHELIKVRVYGDSREDRESFLAQICDQLAAAPVQHIGKLLVIWRPSDTETSSTDSNKTIKNRRNAPRRTKRSFQG